MADKPAPNSKAFLTVGRKAKDSSEHIISNKKTGVLYRDADGSGTERNIRFTQ